MEKEHPLELVPTAISSWVKLVGGKSDCWLGEVPFDASLSYETKSSARYVVADSVPLSPSDLRVVYLMRVVWSALLDSSDWCLSSYIYD